MLERLQVVKEKLRNNKYNEIQCVSLVSLTTKDNISPENLKGIDCYKEKQV